jgi:hypothetical protein
MFAAWLGTLRLKPAEVLTAKLTALSVGNRRGSFPGNGDRQRIRLAVEPDGSAAVSCRSRKEFLPADPYSVVPRATIAGDRAIMENSTFSSEHAS